ncbi:MAG: VirB3 family type IV secretion system protein [Bacteroides sp.]|nr:VirB3 family type IV secretion system protein [Prevotella sp.]MCM1407033.1 VirB3 family type IV secretion system protein [Treponema brennaborense]MCM1470185.1 VirB3 family type IV secretion system protein [Bacteroides sp.]
MEKDSVYNYSTPIHKSLIQDDVQFGIGLAPLCLIVIFTIILMRLVSIWCVLVGMVLVIIAKIATRKDPHFLESLFERILTSNIYRS